MDLDADQLRALAAAVAEGTFDAAARRLHITPSAVSQRIKALETRTGRVLVRRSKPVTPTESSEVLLRAARQLDAIAADVARELGSEADAGAEVPAPPIALAVNADSLATWLLTALAGLEGTTILDLRREDETRTAELLRNGSVMAAVTVAGEAVSGCTVQSLGRMRYRPCASPVFRARWLPDGPSVDALARAPLVAFDRGDVIQDRYLRRRSRRRLDPPRHHVPGSDAFARAIELGFGWGMMPDLLSAPMLESGSLVTLDDTTVDVRLFWQQWRLRSEALDRVAAAVRAGAAAALVC